MGSKIVDNINAIGTEHIPTAKDLKESQSKTKLLRISAVRRQRLFWIIGGCISLFPPLIVGLVRFFMQEASLETIVTMLSSTSIMYTGVTLMVSAINDLDFASERQEVREKVRNLIGLYLIILVLCVMFYSLAEAFSSTVDPTSKTQSNLQSNLKTGFVIVLNFICVFVPSWLGWKQYDESLKRLNSEG